MINSAFKGAFLRIKNTSQYYKHFSELHTNSRKSQFLRYYLLEVNWKRVVTHNHGGRIGRKILRGRNYFCLFYSFELKLCRMVELCIPKKSYVFCFSILTSFGGPLGILCLYVILTISYLRAQTIETSSLPTDSSQPLFKHIEIFSLLTVWLYISTASTFLDIRAS